DRCKVRYRRNRSYLVRSNVLDLGADTAVNSDCVPTIFPDECFLESVLSGRHDDRVDFIRRHRRGHRSAEGGGWLTNHVFQKGSELIHILSGGAFVLRKL